MFMNKDATRERGRERVSAQKKGTLQSQSLIARCSPHTHTNNKNTHYAHQRARFCPCVCSVCVSSICLHFAFLPSSLHPPPSFSPHTTTMAEASLKDRPEFDLGTGQPSLPHNAIHIDPIRLGCHQKWLVNACHSSFHPFFLLSSSRHQ